MTSPIHTLRILTTFGQDEMVSELQCPKPTAFNAKMNKTTYSYFIGAIILVSALGLFSDIFAADSALYAAISKSFVLSGDYSNIYVRGIDWLDKPHFPFWMSALSMEVFGINTFGYKLPSLLFFLLGLFYTHRFTQNLYDVQTARVATVILGSALHIIISNNDVRAEALLVGLLIGATYHIHKLTTKFSTRDILLASLLSAAAVMTKGIFVLIVPYSAVFGHLIFKGYYNRLFNYRWFIVFFLTILFTAPELYSLYQQFDSNPEATAFGEKGVSGIKFFLWDSQFGRFFNTGPIKGNSEPLFFVHTLAWAFAPWALMGVVSLFNTVKNLLMRVPHKEYMSFFGFIIMFLIFSISKFQLSHYLNIIFPFMSIAIAEIITERAKKQKLFNSLMRIFINLNLLLSFCIILFSELYFVENLTIVGVLLLLGQLGACIYFNFSKREIKFRQVVYGVVIALLFSSYLNLVFYPRLLKYQSGAQAAYYINDELPESEVIMARNDWLFEFYLDKPLKLALTWEDFDKLNVSRDELVYVDKKFLATLEENGRDYEIVKAFEHFHTTMLEFKFINHKTRQSVLDERYLIKVL